MRKTYADVDKAKHKKGRMTKMKGTIQPRKRTAVKTMRGMFVVIMVFILGANVL